MGKAMTPIAFPRIVSACMSKDCARNPIQRSINIPSLFLLGIWLATIPVPKRIQKLRSMRASMSRRQTPSPRSCRRKFSRSRIRCSQGLQGWTATTGLPFSGAVVSIRSSSTMASLLIRSLSYRRAAMIRTAMKSYRAMSSSITIS